MAKFIPTNRNRNEKVTFDTLIAALHIIRKQFDEKARLAHNERGQRVIHYRHFTGERLIIGNRHNSKLVYAFKMEQFTETQADTLCKELGYVE